METKEEVKLPKHLAAAIRQLEKQYDKYGDKIGDLIRKSDAIAEEVDMLSSLQSTLLEQIKKLKGDTSADTLVDIAKNLK